MMSRPASDETGRLHVVHEWEALLRSERLETLAAWLATDRLNVWRDVRERQNATIVLEGRPFHVKRFRAPHGRSVRAEVNGIGLLEAAGIATVTLAAWGASPNGEGVLVTRDLTGFRPADQRIAAGESFERFADATADVTGRLHAAGLHHRDLYLCHFLFNDVGEVRLIDAARVRKLPWLTRRRWIVKDLAQFRFSAGHLGVGEQSLNAWLTRWAAHVGSDADRWRAAVERKASSIARHDARLARRQPERYASLR